MVFNAQLRGFANYYGLVNNVKTRLHKLRYIWLGSLLSTLANKYKSSYGKMYQHYRAKGWIISYPTKKGMKATKFFNMDQITDPNDRVHLKPNIYTITRSRSDIVDRFNFEQCEYCGKDSGYFEVHHVKKLSNLKGKTEWERLMIGMQRKTMVLCVQCHDQLHAGTLHSVRK
jgi:5-methylcytosine-specific restriction endonuclease McrA